MSDKGFLKVEGITCDNPSCDFSDTSISFDEYESWVNTPCPKCGTIVLTDNDFQIFKFLIAAVSIGNKLDSQDPRQTSKIYQSDTKV